mmetsp:Transcript_47248/g.100839  ORF Transcript_47248/g.100839 Transcript_47248/m.100839 type:complete len:82 (+) Transcript_47248:648-893(+)
MMSLSKAPQHAEMEAVVHQRLALRSLAHCRNPSVQPIDVGACHGEGAGCGGMVERLPPRRAKIISLEQRKKSNTMLSGREM